MALEAPFSSESDAEAAYYGEDGGGDDCPAGYTYSADVNACVPDDPDDAGPGSCPDGYTWDEARQACVEVGGAPPPGDGEWGPLQEVETLAGGWVLAYQEQPDGGQIRWFVFRSFEGVLVWLDSAGGEYVSTETDTLDDVPSFGTEQAAHDAHAKWAEANPDQAEEGGGGSWSDWMEVDQFEGWFLYVREHTDGRVQFVVSGVMDGENVFLQADGTVGANPAIFTTFDEVDEALMAYFERVENGEIPADQQPIGQPPDMEQLTEDTEPFATEGEGLVEGGNRRLLLVGAAAVGAFALMKQRGEASE